MESQKPWLKIAGSTDLELERLVAERVKRHHEDGDYSLDNQLYIRDINLSVTKNDFRLSGKKQELLRRLCQIYHVELLPQKISSHRRYIGPSIVFFKKTIFSLLKPLLSKSLAQQREFNATVITMLAHIANEATAEKNDHS